MRLYIKVTHINQIYYIEFNQKIDQYNDFYFIDICFKIIQITNINNLI